MNELIPPGEKEKMDSHPVDPSKLEFKPGKGLTVKSADGDFELTTRLRAQFLYTMLDTEGTVAQSLQVRRLRASFSGSVFGEHNRYAVELGLAGREVLKDGVVTNGPILDAYAEFDHIRDLTFRVGQYKAPFGRQQIMSEGNLQFVDVSTVTTEFTYGRDVGLDFRSKDLFGLGMLRYVLGAYTGQGRNSFANSEFDMLLLARLEGLPLGKFEDGYEADFERKGPGLSIGVSVGHQSGGLKESPAGAAPADGGTTDFTVFEADAIFKVSGFSAQTEFFFRKGDRNGTGAGLAPSRDGIGWYGQGGFLLPAMPLEIVARYGLISGKTDAGHNGLGDSHELGGGLNYYIARHPLKLALDYFRLYGDDISDAENQLRLQLQVAL